MKEAPNPILAAVETRPRTKKAPARRGQSRENVHLGEDQLLGETNWSDQIRASHAV